MDMFLDNPAPPLGLLCSASLLCGGMDIRIVDQRTQPDWRASLAAALDDNTAAVGITCMVGGIIVNALEAAREVVAVFSELEQLDAHGRSMEIRFETD